MRACRTGRFQLTTVIQVCDVDRDTCDETDTKMFVTFLVANSLSSSWLLRFFLKDGMRSRRKSKRRQWANFTRPSLQLGREQTKPLNRYRLVIMGCNSEEIGLKVQRNWVEIPKKLGWNSEEIGLKFLRNRVESPKKWGWKSKEMGLKIRKIGLKGRKIVWKGWKS